MIRMAELREMKMEETGESVDKVERCIFLIEERSWVSVLKIQVAVRRFALIHTVRLAL
jgi:hypothetical protein